MDKAFVFGTKDCRLESCQCQHMMFGKNARGAGKRLSMNSIVLGVVVCLFVCFCAFVNSLVGFFCRCVGSVAGPTPT